MLTNARIMPGWHWPAVAEFHGYTGDCTQDALMAALAASRNLPPTPAWLNSITSEMIARHMAAPSGGTTIANVAEYARGYGYPIIAEYDYQEPLQVDVQSLLNENAGINPIVLQVANGQALQDGWQHGRDEPGLHYHAIAVLGVLPNGDHICMDGDSPASFAGRFCAYSSAVIAAARPCGLLIVGKQV